MSRTQTDADTSTSLPPLAEGEDSSAASSEFDSLPSADVVSLSDSMHRQRRRRTQRAAASAMASVIAARAARLVFPPR